MSPQIPNRRPLEDERFQVIVIGGGANGVAIARECARSGRRTLLVEQNDFGSGSTFRTSQIVSGGLHEVEQRNLGEARKQLRDQDVLLRAHPHQVKGMDFLLALGPESQRNNLKMKSALWLYKQMQTSHLRAGEKTEPQKLQRLLPNGGRWSVLNYEDAFCAHPERLIATWIAEAEESGAVVRNYAQVLAIDIRHGRVQGVLLRDQLSGREERVAATWVINATGPWAERLCQRSRVEIRTPILSTMRSTHLALPSFSETIDSAIVFEGPGKQLFSLLPWNGQLLLGYAEAADRSDPSKVSPAMQDVDTLLGALQRFIPNLQVSRQDVRYAVTGFYAKPAGDATGLASLIHDHGSHGATNLFTVVGGTFASALRVAHECAAKCGSTRRSADDNNALLELPDHWITEIRDSARINEESATIIAEWHGKRSLSVAQLAASDARMRAPLCSHSEHIVAEAVDAYKGELAITLADVLLRRVPVALNACWSQLCSREAVMRLRPVMGWTEQQAAAELEAFEMERNALLYRPSSARLQALQTAAD